jgi:hypothetical protein
MKTNLGNLIFGERAVLETKVQFQRPVISVRE